MSIGITETQETLIAANELTLFFVKEAVAKKGMVTIAIDLIAKLQGDAEFLGKLQAAIDKIGQVPSEINDLEVGEVVLLGGTQLSFIPKYIEALKGA